MLSSRASVKEEIDGAIIATLVFVAVCQLELLQNRVVMMTNCCRLHGKSKKIGQMILQENSVQIKVTFNKSCNPCVDAAAG